MSENIEAEYYAALHKCAERYRDMIYEREAWDGNVIHAEIRKFNYEFMFGCRDKLPLMKLNRWLGYIQGVLIERGLTTVQAERDWTRPLFRHLDYA
jgi:hypothetical protein